MFGRVVLSSALCGAWWLIAGATQGQDAPCDGCAAVESNALLATGVLQPGKQRPIHRGPPKRPQGPPNRPQPAQSRSDPTPPAQSQQDVDGMLLNAACQPAGTSPKRRVRTEIRQTDPSMWTLLRTSWRNIEESRMYDYFGERHNEAYGGGQDDHGGPTYTSFLAFHRMFGLDLENMLRQEAINSQLESVSTICEMTVPYWDWSDHKLDQVLNSDYLGTTDPKSGCVIDGLPGGFETPMSWVKDRSGQACVARTTRANWKPRYDVTVFRIGSNAGTDFEKLADDLEKMHNDLHGQMGGNMANKVGYHSPSEPTFFFHHHFTDYLWYRWQTQHEALNIESLRATLSAVSSNDREFLAPWVSLYNSQSDCVLVPGSSQAPTKIDTCLSYEDAADNAMLVQGSEDMDTCATLKAQIMNNECTDEDLKALPCINTTECLTYTRRSLCNDDSEDDCQGFVKLQDDEMAHGEDCANIVAPPTPNYEFCHDCSFRCSGR